MAVKLTKRAVDAMPRPASRRWIFDSELAGFLLRLSPGGARTFYARYRTAPGRGAPFAWVKLGEYGAITVEQARDAAKRVLAAVAGGGDPAKLRTEHRAAQTVAALAPTFLDDVRARRKASTAAEYKRLFNRDVIPALGTRRAADVSSTDIVRLHDAMSDRKYMANRVVATLGSFFTWCESHGHRPKHTNPATDVEPYLETARERFLTGEELARLGAALIAAETIGIPPAPSKRRKPPAEATAKHRPKTADVPHPSNPVAVAVIRFLCLSGWREGEARMLRWDELDEKRGHAILGDTKTGRSVRPLGAAAWAFLGALPREDGSDYVFPGGKRDAPIATITRTWQAVRCTADLQEVRIHDLRHTAASIAAAGGLSLPLIGALLGHRNPSTTQKYAHLADDPRRLAADRFAGDVAAALAGTKTAVTPLRRSSSE